VEHGATAAISQQTALALGSCDCSASWAQEAPREAAADLSFQRHDLDGEVAIRVRRGVNMIARDADSRNVETDRIGPPRASVACGSCIAPDRQSRRPIRTQLFDGDFAALHVDAINRNVVATIRAIRVVIIYSNFG
jgi:hypothetical protein